MSRDIKLNKMQHTVAKLRELVVSYVAYPELRQEGGGYLGFRAPKKRSLKSRF
jgi:nucleolar protein 16